MKLFKLPDLGEGLQEAEILEWHVKVGDKIALDQLLVSVETAKAIVELPSPQDGIVGALFGQSGDLIHTGEPLMEYAGEHDADTGTVVGEMQESVASEEPLEVDHFIIGSGEAHSSHKILATPSIRALAKRMGLDLAQLKGSGQQGMITSADLERAAQIEKDFGSAKALKGVRRVMAKNMTKAHQEVVKVTINDEVDIFPWYPDQDPSIRLIQAIGLACKQEPNLNAWYDGSTMTLRIIDTVDLGIAVDTPDGLFVPVLRKINERSMENIRQGLDKLRADVKSRTIPPKELSGATITLSNFGTIAGRYGNPVVMPPTVSILGAGKIYDAVVPHKGKPTVHPVLPLSLSFDHRVVTGGEAARFMAVVIAALESKMK